jgi:ribosomal protein S18 acetylase RimI-like enzyme
MPLPKVSPANIDALCAVFADRGRVPHVVFLDTFVPALREALPAAGLSEVSCAPVMVCTQTMLTLPPLPPDVSIVTLSADSLLDDVREGLDVNELGFDPHASRATDEAATQFRQTLHNCRAFTLRYHGQGVSAGMFLPIHNGVTEVAGIATLASFRRRGFAGIATAYITQAAFDYGADVVFLTGANNQAERVYRRVGFEGCGSFRTYWAQQPE